MWDQALFEAIHRGLHHSVLDPLFWVISSTGLGFVQVPLVLLTLFGRESRKWTLPLLLAFAISGGVNILLKASIERDRPSNLSIAEPQEQFYHASFPSGHSATSFGLAIALLFLTQQTKYAWSGWVAILWATLVGFSRIYRGVHWPTDVLGGVAIGLLSACLAVSISVVFRNKRPQTKSTS